LLCGIANCHARRFHVSWCAATQTPRDVRSYFCLLHISLAGSLWHPCPDCTERLSLRSGHPDGQGANFQTLWLFESDFDEYVDALAAQTLDDIGPLSPCVSYCCALFYTPLISAPSPAGHLFCFVSRSPLFCRKAGPRRPTDSDNWQGLLSPLQKFPISVLLLSSQRAPYRHGINDFIGNSMSVGHSQAGQTLTHAFVGPRVIIAENDYLLLSDAEELARTLWSFLISSVYHSIRSWLNAPRMSRASTQRIRSSNNKCILLPAIGRFQRDPVGLLGFSINTW
jgi:hypothetical protein